MKTAEKKFQSAKESVVVEPSVVTLSIHSPIPAELAKRFGTSMGLYDRPEHKFRMYAAVALG